MAQTAAAAAKDAAMAATAALTAAADGESITRSGAEAALTAAADGEPITKSGAEAADATEATEAKDTQGKDKEILPSYKKGRRLRSTTKNESVRSAKRSKNVSETTKGRQDKKKFRRSWKNSKEQGTSPVSRR